MLEPLKKLILGDRRAGGGIPAFRKTLLFTLAGVFLTLLAREAYIWHNIEIVADGRKIVTRTGLRTKVEDILRREGIKLGEHDLVVPPLSSPVPRRKPIVIVRVTDKTEQLEDGHEFDILWTKRSKTNLRTVELQKGVLRRRFREVSAVFHDGRPQGRKVVRQWQTKRTVHRLALLHGDGTVEKIYDLSQCRKVKMVATAYYPGDPLCWGDGTITFLGHKMQRGIVAVDPKVIPLRTRVYVPDYGYGYAGDTGSAIKGSRIDLGVNNRQEEKPWMHRPVTVYLLEESKTW